ncbi:DUF948 domain-containing protein [Streptococcus marmotae]|uniref:DUF948 domain-containing protein n=1 Tax=Streptococcus marmotae TaxID=1825069 RepID=UPI0008363040
MIELSVFIIAIALGAVAVYVILLLKKVSNVVDEAQHTLNVLTSDVNVTLYQTNELLAKTNVLVADVNGKVATLDPLFVAVADLSESVSDLNTSARGLTAKARTAGQHTVKAGGALAAVSKLSSILGKKGAKQHG